MATKMCACIMRPMETNSTVQFVQEVEEFVISVSTLLTATRIYLHSLSTTFVMMLRKRISATIHQVCGERTRSSCQEGHSNRPHRYPFPTQWRGKYVVSVWLFRYTNTKDGQVARGHFQRVYPGGTGMLLSGDVKGNEKVLWLCEHRRGRTDRCYGYSDDYGTQLQCSCSLSGGTLNNSLS